MGKSSKPSTPSAPSFANSVLKLGTDTIAKTYKNAAGSIVTEVVPTQLQKTVSDYVNNYIDDAFDAVTGFSDNYTNSKNQILDSIKSQTTQNINDTYDPMYKKLKTDIVSRFGNLENSSFLDELDNIEENKTEAIAKNADNLVLLSQQLDDNERLKNSDYLKLLLNIDSNNNALNTSYASTSSSLSNLMNNFNLNNYSNLQTRYSQLLDEYNNSGVLGKYTPLYLK